MGSKFKNLSRITKMFFAGVTIFMMTSCSSNRLPSVSNAQYQSFNTAQEKGYIATFELSNSDIKPSSIVINQIKQEILPEHRTENRYQVRVLQQSSVVFGYRPVIVESENGLNFKVDSSEVFKKVEFQLTP